MLRSSKESPTKIRVRHSAHRQQKVILACVLSFLGIGLWHNMPIFKELFGAFNKEDSIPPSFAFGVASAAYQIEGAADEGGRGQSIWDTFSHKMGKTHNGDTGDVAVDFYHRFESDIQMMQSIGVKMFRFSISWSRVLPQGTGKINKEGIAFYNAVIDKLLALNIEPHVTLYHWDMPQALEDKYDGLLSEKVVEDFASYAETCFKAFGNKVKHWTTFNEPWTFVTLGYNQGMHAPGRCSDRSACEFGDSSREPWVVTHNVLNAHAAAVARFRKLVPTGKISINLNSDWAEPMSSSDVDVAAAQRHLDFMLGLYADPIYTGHYPKSVVERIPALPKFTEKQRKLLQGSTDYFALNHYTSKYVANSNTGDSGVTLSSYRKGRIIGPVGDSEWLNVVPWGFGKMLRYVKDRYSDPEIYVTESGADVPKESKMSLQKALKDDFRVKYFKSYLKEAMKVVQEDDVKLTKYFAWSIVDNFEWADGYAKRFGIIYVDYDNALQRHLKKSAIWLAKYFATPESAS